MPTYDAGDARLRIVPDAREFRAKLEADLKRIQADFPVNVTANTAQAAADIRRFRDVEQRNDVRVGVDVALAQAHADMARFRALQQADAITIPVDVDRNSLQRARSSIASAFEGVGADLFSGVKWNAGAAGIALLPTMATGIAGVTSALQELSQVGLIMPGIMAAAGASIGTVMLGTSGLKDAFKELGKQDGSQKQLDKLNAQLAKLSPNARSFVTAVAEIKPAFTDLQQSVQDNLFAGIGDQLRVLADQDLPVFKAGLGGIAASLNHDLTEVMRVLGSDSSKGLFDRILGNTSDAQERFKTAIEPLLTGITTLAAAGTDVLPRLADGFGKASERFNAFITNADGNGDLDKWINQGIDGLTHLGNTVINLGKPLNAITTAMGGGDGLLAMLERGTNRLQTFLNSTQGQDMLQRVFQEGRDELDKWLPLLEQLPGLFQGVLAASQQWTSVILPPLTQIATVLGEHPGLVQAVATAFVAWKTISGITSLITALGVVSTALSALPATAAASAAGMSAAFAPVLAALAPLIALLGTGYTIGDMINADRNAKKTNDEFQAGQRDFLKGTGLTLPDVPYQSPLGIKPPELLPGVAPSPRASGGFAFGENGGAPLLPSDGAGTASDGWLFGGSHKTGGPTRSGRGNGPTGGWISELHEDEWVVNARGRANLGDTFLSNVNAGKLPGFDLGGFIDEWGNPVTKGPLPGSGIANTFGSFLGASGLSNPLSVGGGILPGLGGRSSTDSGDAPKDFTHQWFPWLDGFEKTGDPFAGEPDKLLPQNIAYQFGQTLLGGVLGGLGLNQSFLSPTNRYNQAAQKTAGFYFNKFGGGATAGGSSALSDADVAARLAQAGLNPDQIGAVITSRDETAKRDAMRNQLAGLGLSESDISAALKAQGGNGKAPAANYNGGSDQLHNTVFKAFTAAGFPIAQWPDMVNLINGESSWNPKAKNPSSTAYGLGQFLDSTWATVGGSKTSNAGEQARLMMSYIAGRYGDPAKAWAFWQAQSPHWYDVGGLLPTGMTVVRNDTGQNERVLTPQQNKSFEALVDHATNPPDADAQIGSLRPPGGGRSGAVAQPPSVAPQPHAGSGAAPGPEQHGPSQQKDQQKPVTAPQVSAAPSSYDHELPALKTAVNSTASTLGSLAQSAVGAAPFPGAGQAGAMIAGLIKQGGKIVNDVINIPSSFLVGNITPGTQDSAYGTTLTSPAQRPSSPTPGRVQNNQFYGMDVNRVFSELDLRDAQDHQAALAARPR